MPKASKNWKQVKQNLLKDADVRDEYEQLSPFVQIAKEIHRVRIEANLSQKQLADKIGTSQANIARVESMNYEGISVKTLLKIADALHLRLKIEFEGVA